ncbi:SUMF1/EgtB/PvdO family nonheme iron enzyme [Arenicella xantha]|uniref:Sulfatase-modifying factor enzyme 1 n=1 Tax=Arenicella xantha TaxID=644221 RepID=A0A395JLL8_9GAMM|nr:SUMF1/EgtB/PvdO family nonheme iron enzyme [Arenicella xantha]RBP51683.1 sulfatase-modifying factor enzyme 1 [Arenicella xantha]
MLVNVASFYIDKYQLTNAQFLTFTEQFDSWSRANIKRIFADATCLQHFAQPHVDELADQAVVNVSWFAAMAYCKAQGKCLPSLDKQLFCGAG